MTSKEALYLLMTNQKKVRGGFKFIDLNTHEQVSIEECYDIVIKDLERLEKLEKAFEILIDKKVNILVLKYFIENGEGVEAYNLYYTTEEQITQEEYELLEEALEDE